MDKRTRAKFTSLAKKVDEAGGAAATTVSVGGTKTLPAGSDANVYNSGTTQKIVLEFEIPQGATGAKGDKGDKGDAGPQGPKGDSYTLTSADKQEIANDAAASVLAYIVNTYSSFASSSASAGSITVTKKAGMCFVNAGITLTGPVSGWTTLLDSSKVPGPQNGQPIYATLPSWKEPTTNPARLRVPADGGLQITRGSANAFWINLAYPIN